jgi:hypothetical protein
MSDGFGDFRLGFESAALDAKGELAANSAAIRASVPDHGHYPYARPVRDGWHRDAGGHWAYDTVDEHQWEVFCAECGDTDGPAADQAPGVQELRGPYRGKHQAKHVADKHFHAFSGAH